ncbi:CU044_5270 family protein [Streptomyces sp. NPDC059568]|uniref:CU044_5270 family protein n=1 Tax=Streptomyces sp. NPDC059568 TaxID=3346868 RepID=UPI0036896FD5
MSALPERDLPPGRHSVLKNHLLQEIQLHEVRRDQAHSPRAATSAPGRWLRPGLMAMATAAVVALALAVIGVTDGQPASAQAAELLQNIASAAEQQDVPADIRDDQYVYIRSTVAATVHEGNGPGVLAPVHRREVWFSVDGSRPGLLEENTPGNRRQPLGVEVPGNNHNTNYRHLQTLPTAPDAMLRWLRKTAGGGTSNNQKTFVLVGDLAGESLMPPAVSAALFRAAAMIPGVELTPNTTDALGRRGVAVTRTDDGIREELIFDVRTHAYLGEREVAVKTTKDFTEGQTLSITAIQQRTVVDSPGQRPS